MYIISSEIAEVINKNLPAAVGTELQKRLKQADELEQQVADLTTKLKSTLQRLEQLITTKSSVEAVAMENVNRAKRLDDREALLRDKEFEYRLASVRVEAAQLAKADIMKLAEVVFRNPRLVISESSQVHKHGPAGMYMNPVSESKFTTQTEE